MLLTIGNSEHRYSRERQPDLASDSDGQGGVMCLMSDVAVISTMSENPQFTDWDWHR
jgi:hypothetical protein